jgi:hypothetical protein
VEMTIIVFVAAVVGLVVGQPLVDRVLLIVLVPLAFLATLGHFVAIMASRRVRS